MIDKINELIEMNLNYLFTEPNFSSFRFRDLNNRLLIDLYNKQLINFMIKEGLITLNGQNFTLTPSGLFIAENGGWMKHLDDEAKLIAEKQSKIDARQQLETELAKSNIDANKLNKKIAEQNFKDKKSNKITTWTNIIIWILNLGLLVLQLLKAG